MTLLVRSCDARTGSTRNIFIRFFTIEEEVIGEERGVLCGHGQISFYKRASNLPKKKKKKLLLHFRDESKTTLKMVSSAGLVGNASLASFRGGVL